MNVGDGFRDPTGKRHQQGRNSIKDCDFNVIKYRDRARRCSPNDVGEHLAESGHVVDVQGAELAEHEAGLDGGDERFDH